MPPEGSDAAVDLSVIPGFEELNRSSSVTQSPGRTKGVPLQSSASEILAGLYRIFGRVLIVSVPFGKKEAIFRGWREPTFEDTQTPKYRQTLLAYIEQGGT